MEAIGVKDLSFAYRGSNRWALKGIDYEQEEGEVVALLGRGGAGKSTLVRCLNRIIPALYPGNLQGQIRLFGRTLSTEGVGQLADTVGMIFQDFEAQLFSTSVLHEMTFGLGELGLDARDIQERVAWALGLVGLEGFVRRDPATLSGGEKQRLAIAAILAMRPRLLVLDEPTTDLDPLGKEKVLEILRWLKDQGFTILLVTHESEDPWGIADRLALLDEGKMVAQGPLDELLTRTVTLQENGVRPLPLAQLYEQMGLPSLPADVSEAYQMLDSKGLRPDRQIYRKDTQKAREDQERRYGPVLLQVEGLWFCYPNGVEALRGVDLEIREGEFVALLGHNGSGKTTLAKHFNGLLRPQRGRVFLRGKDVSRLSLYQLAQQAGFVFQNPDHQLFAATVEEEVAFGPRNFGLVSPELERTVARTLEVMGLKGCEKTDPFGLTKGERQRLAVASVLSSHPHLLILDEPTTGLDYQEQRRMMELLKGLNEAGHTVVIITHSPWVIAEYAHRALVLSRGQVLADGPLREVFEQEELLREASFKLPSITSLGRKFGITPLSVEEFIGYLPAPSPRHENLAQSSK